MLCKENLLTPGPAFNLLIQASGSVVIQLLAIPFPLPTPCMQDSVMDPAQPKTFGADVAPEGQSQGKSQENEMQTTASPCLIFPCPVPSDGQSAIECGVICPNNRTLGSKLKTKLRLSLLFNAHRKVNWKRLRCGVFIFGPQTFLFVFLEPNHTRGLQSACFLFITRPTVTS